jgi:hypothetical protein
MWCLLTLVMLAPAAKSNATEVPVGKQHDDSFLRPIRPFSAVLVEYNKHNEVLKQKTKLTLSNHGMRSESLSRADDEPHMVFIQDYDTSRRWLASPARACYSELPKEAPAAKNADLNEKTDKQPSILSLTPCNGAKAEKLSTRAIKNTELSVWKCTDEEGRFYIQHFSTLLGMVIRQESQEGEIGELIDLTLVSHSPGYFKPSNTWREVTLEEFITGKVILPAYEN